MWVDPSLIQLLADQYVERPARNPDPDPGGPLDERQRKVILGILSGLTNKRIGDEMGLSEGTIKNILQGLFIRTGVRTRSQLVRLALEGSMGDFSQVVKRTPLPAPSGDSAGSLAQSDAVTTPPVMR